MENTTKRSFIAILISLLLATGIAIAGGQGGVQGPLGLPLFALCIAIAFIIQWIAFIPAYAQKTESFYDLTGSITYLLVTGIAVRLSPNADPRSYLLFGLITLWAVRLGTFLFSRTRAAGEDRRFREIKISFSRFLLAWTLQGLWVTFSLAAALAAITSEIKLDLGIFALIGTLVWLFGFAVEVIADRQKSKFKTNPDNKDKFINTGLWSWSRHPNYFGEIVLWIGIAIITLPILRGWQWLMLISPIFIIILLTKISGVPMLEKRSDEKWGGQEAYEAYKASTPILIPLPPSKEKSPNGLM